MLRRHRFIDESSKTVRVPGRRSARRSPWWSGLRKRAGADELVASLGRFQGSGLSVGVPHGTALLFLLCCSQQKSPNPPAITCTSRRYMVTTSTTKISKNKRQSGPGKRVNFFSPIWHFYEVKVAKHLSRLVRTGVAKQRSLSTGEQPDCGMLLGSFPFWFGGSRVLVHPSR